MRSGIRSSSCNKALTRGAVPLLCLLKGRSWSASSGCFQLDLALRRRSKVFIVSRIIAAPARRRSDLLRYSRSLYI